MKGIRFFLSAGLLLLCSSALAAVAIETTVSRSRLGVGEELTLDIIVSDADGPISKPKIGSMEGFTSYSQGHSQEISIINGKKSSRSVFSYMLIANSAGTKSIGPFEVEIGNRRYKAAPVEVVVTATPSGSSSSGSASQTPGFAPVTAPPSRALPSNQVGSEDIFVKAWLDKDEAYVNEPVTLTYTLYTRLTATYKGFEKEPETTGFWIEDFPPDKTVRRTEQVFNGSRYVVADVRKTALFPTQPGVYTIDPGILSATVEIRDDGNFDTFFSYNVFGRRGSNFPSFVSQVVPKLLSTEKLALTVKALPEIGKPKDFSGAVGDYRVESIVDKTDVEAGEAVTYRVRVLGEGNINTVQMPVLPPIDNFKIYDSSTSTNISKERLKVEGEKVTETVIVPKKAGTFTIPSLHFVYFDTRSASYKGVHTEPKVLTVRPSTAPLEDESESSSAGVESADPEDVAMLGKDIRYIKASDTGRPASRPLHRNPLYWIFNLILISAAIILFALPKIRSGTRDVRGARMRRSHQVARQRLKNAASLMKKGESETFYAELSRAVYGYFADKLSVPAQSVNVELIEEKAGDEAPPQLISQVKALLNELSLRRFARAESGAEEMKRMYSMADEAITAFEKVKLK